jgi:hypothetical protein
VRGVIPCLAVALSVLALIFSSSAAASGFDPYHRACPEFQPTLGMGSIETTPVSFTEVTGPWHIATSYATVKNVLRRLPSFFGSAGTRANVCLIAYGVAIDAIRASVNWREFNGTVGVTWPNYYVSVPGHDPAVYLGVFRCSGYRTARHWASETCSHNRDRHAGKITVSFRFHGISFG